MTASTNGRVRGRESSCDRPARRQGTASSSRSALGHAHPLACGAKLVAAAPFTSPSRGRRRFDVRRYSKILGPPPAGRPPLGTLRALDRKLPSSRGNVGKQWRRPPLAATPRHRATAGRLGRCRALRERTESRERDHRRHHRPPARERFSSRSVSGFSVPSVLVAGFRARGSATTAMGRSPAPHDQRPQTGAVERTGVARAHATASPRADRRPGGATSRDRRRPDPGRAQETGLAFTIPTSDRRRRDPRRSIRPPPDDVRNDAQPFVAFPDESRDSRRPAERLAEPRERGARPPSQRDPDRDQRDEASFHHLAAVSMRPIASPTARLRRAAQRAPAPPPLPERQDLDLVAVVLSCARDELGSEALRGCGAPLQAEAPDERATDDAATNAAYNTRRQPNARAGATTPRACRQGDFRLPRTAGGGVLRGDTRSRPSRT